MAAGTFDSSVLSSGWFSAEDAALSGWFDRMLAADTAPPPVTPARGPATAAVILIDSEAGATVTYSWATDVLRSRSGLEHRLSLIGCPRETYVFSALLSDKQLAVLQSELVLQAAAADAFGIGLAYEAVQITASSSGATIAVTSTDFSDWMYAGQTVAVQSSDMQTFAVGVIQSFTSTSITLDVSVPATLGGRVMPTIPSFLDDTQTLALHTVNVGTYQLKARATYFGNATSDWAPRGAPSVASYTDPVTTQVYSVYDRGLVTEDTTPRATMGGTELVDRGGVLFLSAAQVAVDFQREIFALTASSSDRQYLKAFLGAVVGRRKAFLLPTWKPDLVQIGNASTSVLKVFGPPTVGAGDYAAQWKQSPAHKHLQLLRADGTVAYRTVTDAADNGDGTQNLQLDSALAGTLSMVSFLEQCRLDTDDIPVAYSDGAVGTCRIPARVVQQ